MPIDIQLWYARIGLYNTSNNCCFLLTIHHNTTKNNLFTKIQSGFLPSDSCISQLLSITHKIYKLFDCNPSLDITGTFLDISKAFEKVWYEGLIFKSEIYGKNDKLLNLMQDYLL